MTIFHHTEFAQGSDEWRQARCSILTASEMKLIVTPTLKIASNDKERSHLYELVAQRITQYVEPHYVSDSMLRGKDEEILAREEYKKKHDNVREVGFITNDKWGFKIGYSPDFLCGMDGQGECKSRCQKYQIETIVTGVMPEEFSIQVQTGLLVTENAWCDFISYSGGLPMKTIRIEPDEKAQKAIVEAATIFNEKMEKMLKVYADQLADPASGLIPTERVIEQDIIC